MVAFLYSRLKVTYIPKHVSCGKDMFYFGFEPLTSLIGNEEIPSLKRGHLTHQGYFYPKDDCGVRPIPFNSANQHSMVNISKLIMKCFLPVFNFG